MVTVTFDVQAPSVFPNAQTGSVQIRNNNVMQLSPLRSGGGRNFSASNLLNPPTYGGSYSWVQLISSSITTAKDPLGALHVCTYGPGLDFAYPYPYSSPTSSNDSPSVGLQPSYVEVTDSDSFRMYLRWQLSAPQAASRYRSRMWIGDGQVTHGEFNGIWALAISSIAPHVFVQSYGLPIWSDYVLTSTGHGVSCH